VQTRLLLMFLLLPVVVECQSYSESALTVFSSATNGPVLPTGGLIIDGSGHLYGSAQGGANHLGAIFEISPLGTLSEMHSFDTSDGSYPQVNPVRDKAGNLYGTTSMGGASASCACGTLFKLTPGGEETVLHNFTGGFAYPSALALDASANLYGLEYANASGSIYEVATDGTFSVLYKFCSLSNCSDGSIPVGSLIIDRTGNFYGATNQGGDFGKGTVFKLAPDRSESVLYSFTGGTDGGDPSGKLTEDAAGNLYGVTYSGGISASGIASTSGAVFKITPAGAESVLYSFCQLANCKDGAQPQGPLAIDALGNLYGTTTFGGPRNHGVVFKLTPAGAESVLHDLSIQADGGNGVVLDREGNVYFEIYSGGKNNLGSVIKLTPRIDLRRIDTKRIDINSESDVRNPENAR
jgi:uncharacterized repeat protein (TIGR03803 family)